MKPGLNPDEVIRRIIVMGHESEVAALSFHHIVIVENLMSIERAGWFLYVDFSYVWFLHIGALEKDVPNSKKSKIAEMFIWIASNICWFF